MASFKLALKLGPSPEGLRQLKSWPDATFTPDFTVAASGVVNFDFDGNLIGAKRDGTLSTVPMDIEEISTFKPDLPDYLAGFALNLAKAAVKIKDSNQDKASAKFLDEPVDLYFNKISEATLKVSLRYHGETVADAEGPKVLILAEIGQALQTFMTDLLRINYRLAEYEEVVELRGLISRLVS